MTELNPCPFCGDKKIEIVWYSLHKSCSVLCTRCKADIAPCQTEEQAAEAWNRRASGWISVKDRLPEEETPELLFSADGKVYYGSFGYSKFYAIDSDGIFSGFTAYEVSHWMPLPEPPEQKGEES